MTAALVTLALLGGALGAWVLAQGEEEGVDSPDSPGAQSRREAGCPLTDEQLRALLRRFVSGDDLTAAELGALASCSTGERSSPDGGIDWGSVAQGFADVAMDAWDAYQAMRGGNATLPAGADAPAFIAGPFDAKEQRS